MVKIYLDPGHGGSDPGAQGYGLQEKNLTLAIATQIRSMIVNGYDGVEVRMSRTSDRTMSLAQRTNDANAWGANFYLSVHINAGGGTGFESFIYPNLGAPTTTFQNHIHNEVLKRINLKDRGKKRANFHVLRESNMPAVLTENGFIDNSSDAAKLKSSAFITSLAQGHVNGIVIAFGLKPKKAEPSPNPGTTPPAKLYRVQIGAYKEKSNADTMGKQAKDKGFDTYIFQQDGLYKVQIGAYADRKNAEEFAERAKNVGFSPYINYS